MGYKTPLLRGTWGMSSSESLGGIEGEGVPFLCLAQKGNQGWSIADGRLQGQCI